MKIWTLTLIDTLAMLAGTDIYVSFATTLSCYASFHLLHKKVMQYNLRVALSIF